MPELPDVTVYVEALERRMGGEVLQRTWIKGPFLLRTFAPPPEELAGRRVVGLSRLGKRIVVELDGPFWMVLHLMIAGRLHWHAAAPKLTGKNLLAVWEFSSGWLSLTEASPKKRAGLWLLAQAHELAQHRSGGLEVFSAGPAEFADRLRSENHTLKRALTDPRLLDGIGHAYSDEILHRARLSPLALTGRLTDDELAALHAATVETLSDWTNRLRAQCGEGFPERVTAFRPEMAVHGRYGEPCPECGTTVQRIRYAENETNYCPRCQTGGRVLADRSLSRLLKDDWPRSIELWE